MSVAGAPTRFRYRAATAEGRLVEGELDAPSRAGALEALRRQRLVPVDVDPVAAREGSRPRWSRTASPDVALATWARTMATMLGAGLPLDHALGFTAEHASDDRLGEALRAAREAVRGGAPLHQALARRPEVFGALAPAVAAAGEEGGVLDVALARLADQLETAAELRAQLRGALLYPALMGVAASLGVTVLLLVVVPRFVAILRDVGGELPLSTRLLAGASAALVGAWWVWLPLVAVTVVLARGWLRDDANRARLHAWRLRWPVSGALERAWATAQVTRTLGLLTQTGVGALPALRLARATVGNLAVSAEVARAEERVRQGERVSAALAPALTPLAAQLLAAGEEGGRLPELALRVAEAHDAAVRRTLASLVRVVEPALILVFGVIVGFVALAMLQAVYSVRVEGL